MCVILNPPLGSPWIYKFFILENSMYHIYGNHKRQLNSNEFFSSFFRRPYKRLNIREGASVGQLSPVRVYCQAQCLSVPKQRGEHRVLYWFQIKRLCHRDNNLICIPLLMSLAPRFCLFFFFIFFLYFHPLPQFYFFSELSWSLLIQFKLNSKFNYYNK